MVQVGMGFINDPVPYRLLPRATQNIIQFLTKTILLIRCHAFELLCTVVLGKIPSHRQD